MLQLATSLQLASQLGLQTGKLAAARALPGLRSGTTHNREACSSAIIADSVRASHAISSLSADRKPCYLKRRGAFISSFLGKRVVCLLYLGTPDFVVVFYVSGRLSWSLLCRQVGCMLQISCAWENEAARPRSRKSAAF